MLPCFLKKGSTDDHQVPCIVSTNVLFEVPSLQRSINLFALLVSDEELNNRDVL